MSDRTPQPSNFAARLAELTAAATPGPWEVPKTSHRYLVGDRVPMAGIIEDARLMVLLRNHAEAILALVEAVEEELEAERQVAIQSPAYFGLGPDDVFERRDAAIRNKWTALEALDG